MEFPRNKGKIWLATLLECVNMQNLKLNLKKNFIFFLTVYFCCDVGERDLELKPSHWAGYGSYNFL